MTSWRWWNSWLNGLTGSHAVCRYACDLLFSWEVQPFRSKMQAISNARVFHNSYCNVHQTTYHSCTAYSVPCVVRIGDPLSRLDVWTVSVSSPLGSDSPHKPEMVDSLWPREPTGRFRPTCVGSIRIVLVAWLERQVSSPHPLVCSRPFCWLCSCMAFPLSPALRFEV